MCATRCWPGSRLGRCKVFDIGVQPTPTCGLAVRRLHTAGGIQITASHNPAPWNGLKLFGADGAVLPATKESSIQDRYQSRAFRNVGWNELGHVEEVAGAADWHRERILQLVDAKAIRKANLEPWWMPMAGPEGRWPRACSRN